MGNCHPNNNINTNINNMNNADIDIRDDNNNNNNNNNLASSTSTTTSITPTTRDSIASTASSTRIVPETRNASYSESVTGERRLNQYLIIRVLGNGAFGTVHLALNTDTNTRVAVKEFSKSRLRRNRLSRMSSAGGFRGLRGRGRGGRGGAFGAGLPGHTTSTSASASTSADANATLVTNLDDPMDLVRTEVAIMKKLNHNNVVKLLEVLDDPSQDSLWMVYELCDNGVLMDVSLDKPSEPLSEIPRRKYFTELVLGIEYLHENDIAHRDIKPDNLMLSKENVLKIVDFGVSEFLVKGNDKSKHSAGSPAFYSPELCTANHGEISAKAADIWAMGVTLYCMAFGKLPFTGNSIVEIYENIKKKQLDIPSTCDPQLTDLLRKMLEKDPSKRITISDIRVHPWVTQNGQHPLISRAENLEGLVHELTEEDLRSAITKISTLFTVMKAVSKFKSMHHRASIDGITSNSTGSHS